MYFSSINKQLQHSSTVLSLKGLSKWMHYAPFDFLIAILNHWNNWPLFKQSWRISLFRSNTSRTSILCSLTQATLVSVYTSSSFGHWQSILQPVIFAEHFEDGPVISLCSFLSSSGGTQESSVCCVWQSGPIWSLGLCFNQVLWEPGLSPKSILV